MKTRIDILALRLARERRRAIAWLCLAATLFSAISPAMAGVMLNGRAEALGRMLGISPAVEAPSHSAHHHDSAPEPEPAPHADHGIYCSLCLNASSTVTIAGASTPAVIPSSGSERIATVARPVFITAFHAFFRSRAPPALILSS